MLHSTVRTAKTALPKLASVAHLPWEAKELDGAVPLVASHAKVGGRDSRGAPHAPPAVVGCQVDLKLGLAQVL